MSAQTESRERLLKLFENKVIQGRELLKFGNHKWADKVFTNLHFEIQKADWIEIQKRNQLYSLINNSWRDYISSLTQVKEEGKAVDIIKYIDAYNRFFNLLSQQDNYVELMRYGNELVLSFINQPNISIKGVVKFMNSLSVIMQENDNNQELLQTQLMIIFLKKSLEPSPYYYHSMEYLAKSLKKVEPNKRHLLLYIILENVASRYGVSEQTKEFVGDVNKILVSRAPPELKSEFSKISRISIDESNFDEILSDLEGLIMYLNDIGETSWVLTIIENVFLKFVKYKTYNGAVEYIRGYTYFLIRRGRFEIAFKIYDILESYFGSAIDLEYNFPLIELWAEACKWLVELEDKKYLLMAIDRFQKSIIIPANPKQILHYFYSHNLLWKLKSGFFSLEKQEFWNMLFFRAFFEESDLKLSESLIKFLPEKIQPLMTNLTELKGQCEQERSNIYLFDQTDETLPSIFNDIPNLKVKEYFIRIHKSGQISMYGRSEDLMGFFDSIIDERWNDFHLMELYHNIFFNSHFVENLGLIEFGRIMFMCLPKKIRNLLMKFQTESTDKILNLFLVLDEMTIPFDLVHDGKNFISNTYSIGYSIGGPSLKDLTSQAIEEYGSQTHEKKYKALIIGALNLMMPTKWDDEQGKNVLMYPFQEGVNELNFALNYFNNCPNIEQLMYSIQENLTRDNILNNIISGTYDIIHIIGNLFYSDLNPKASYFLTNDYQIVSILEINDAIKVNYGTKKPLLFLNIRCFDLKGNELKSNIQVIPKIIRCIEQNNISGSITRLFSYFNDDTRNIMAIFYDELTNGQNQGVSLLKARQRALMNQATESGGNISTEALIAANSFILFGKPWKLPE